MTELVTEITLLPTGMTLDTPDTQVFAVLVSWRGPSTETGRGGYAVTHVGRHLSHRGIWRFSPEPFVQRHFRWADIDDALAAAREVVDTIVVNGRTWAEWESLRAGAS